MKNPDAVAYAMDNAIAEYFEELGPISDIEEYEEIKEEKINEIQTSFSKYIQYGEYLNIEIDTETNEAKVIPVNKGE